jgi:hypothetical protein
MTAMLSFFFSPQSLQVTTTLTNLNLSRNGLGDKGGKALAKSLEVSFTFVDNSSWLSLYDIEYLIVLLPFSDQQIYHQSQS